MENIDIDKITGLRDVEIPETGVTVKVRDLSWIDLLSSLDIEDRFERGVFRLSKVIVSWNITRGDEPLPVSLETLKSLSAKVVIPIVEAVKDSFGEQKKKTSPGT